MAARTRRRERHDERGSTILGRDLESNFRPTAKAIWGLHAAGADKHEMIDVQTETNARGRMTCPDAEAPHAFVSMATRFESISV